MKYEYKCNLRKKLLRSGLKNQYSLTSQILPMFNIQHMLFPFVNGYLGIWIYEEQFVFNNDIILDLYVIIDHNAF